MGEGEKEKEILLDNPPDLAYVYMIMSFLFYPLIYELMQFRKDPWLYMKQGANFVDLFYVIMGYYNMYCQVYLGSN